MNAKAQFFRFRTRFVDGGDFLGSLEDPIPIGDLLPVNAVCGVLEWRDSVSMKELVADKDLIIEIFWKYKVADETAEKFFLIMNNFCLNRAIIYFLLLDCVDYVSLTVDDVIAAKDWIKTPY